jgi:hypothetical protein
MVCHALAVKNTAMASVLYKDFIVCLLKKLYLSKVYRRFLPKAEQKGLLEAGLFVT